MDVVFDDVVAAEERIRGVALRTPVHTSSTLDKRLGAQVFFKCENFQKTGAFKFRGACNAIRRLTEEQKRRGVLTFSSGNHAQALALAGRMAGVEVTVVMPTDAPPVKRAATEGYGGTVVPYDRDETTREMLGNKIAEEKGLTIIPPYDHPHIVAGQATAVKELIEEVGQLDWLFVPCGGGGLLSGSAISASALSSGCKVIGVEPAAGDDGARSFRSGKLETVHNPDTIADGARTPSLGQLTFSLIKQHVHDITTVSDQQLLQAMKFLWERCKLVVEPTGALGLAGLLNGGYDVEGSRVGVVLSGGNVDVATVGRLLDGL